MNIIKKKLFSFLSFCFYNFIDNHKLKKKMLMIYVFCVVIPVIATNCIVVGLVVSGEKKKSQKNLYDISAAVEYELKSTINEAISIANTIYAKKNLNKFLETYFRTPLEYFEAYNNLDVMSLFDYGFNTRISGIHLYSNNHTILEGGSFCKIQNIADSSWYKQFLQIDNTISICMYYDKNDAAALSQRKLSLVRKLKNYSGNELGEKFVKIDIDYNKLQTDIINANHSADVYVVCNGKILFTNADNGGTFSEEYIDFDMQSTANPKKFSKIDFSLYKTDFSVISFKQDEPLFSYVHEYIWILLLLLLVNLIIPILVIFGVNKSICERIQLLDEYFEKMKCKNFDRIPESKSHDEIAKLIHSYNIMTDEMDTLIKVSYTEKIERQNLVVAKQQAELLALYSQVNPHFMFNALESIRMRSLIKNENETADIINKLSILMRSSISWKNDTVSIKDELQFSEAYLQLQKYRFGDKLSYKISIDEDCVDFMLPKLSLVTFVENACVHGIEGVKSGGMIFISAIHKNEHIIIEIEDTGIGMDDKTADKMRRMLNNADTDMFDEIGSGKKSIGMLNACIRLKMYFKNDISFEIDTEKGGGTLISITAPYNYENI